MCMEKLIFRGLMKFRFLKILFFADLIIVKMSFHNREDIYETEDVQINERSEPEESFEDKEIEKIHFDVKGAMRRFGNCFLDSEGVDFSHAFRRGKGYKSNEVLGDYLVGANEDNFDNRYNKLLYEVEELISNFDKGKQCKENKVSVTKSQLDDLYAMLKMVELRKNCPNENIYKNSAQTDVDTTSNKERLLNLDERIRRIEKAIHGDKDFNQEHLSPLIETIGNLRIQVESLSPSMIDGANSKISLALSKISELDEKRSKLAIDENEQKIAELYDTFLKLEKNL